MMAKQPISATNLRRITGGIPKNGAQIFFLGSAALPAINFASNFKKYWEVRS